MERSNNDDEERRFSDVLFIKDIGSNNIYLLASALPVIAFGEQLNKDTDGTLSSVETLTFTAIYGIIHAIFGGQSLLILRVAEPTVVSSMGWMDMVEVLALHVFSAIVPAMMIAALYFFYHSVAAQMAQQKEFNLKNPSAYHYDLFLHRLMTLMCGLIGVPPSNGVLPQSTCAHTESFGSQ
ncbi:probable boron transporter 6 [Rutidosis leptorrhynchoides]|uniref:probable boron transporter 6 n=1 Tax=Rutidosis leptorrhynchoides TaxID=125765 RepID=UPI003A996B05